MLEEWLECSVDYTIGWVDVDTGEPLFKFDDTFIGENFFGGLEFLQYKS